MADLASIQHQFMDLLQNNNRALSEHIVQQGELSNQQRLDIYFSAYRIRLTGVLETDHPILGLYLGDELFEQMVQGYIYQYPSHYSSLRQFGDALPEFLSKVAPFSHHPILAEIAAFERNLLRAFDAADIEVIQPAELQSIPAERWPQLLFKLHPSVHFFTAVHNSIPSWQALKQNQSPHPAVELPQPQHWVIWRNPGKLTEFKPLSLAEFRTLQLVTEARTFAEMCECCVEHFDEPNQAAQVMLQWLLEWVAAGFLCWSKQTDI